MKLTRYLLPLILCTALISGCAGPQQSPDASPEAPAASQDEASSNAQTDTQETTPSEDSGETAPGNAGNAQENTADFHLDLDSGTITAQIFYTKNDLLGTSVLLNRDFSVTSIICDGEEVDPEEIRESIMIEDVYEASRYLLPHFDETLAITYTGTLSGQTGSSPYVRETISPEFTMLRWETYCFPLFGEDWHSLLDTLDFYNPVEAQMTLHVPEEYVAATPYPLIDQSSADGITSYTFRGDITNFNCAIAQYEVVQLPSGEYYFLPGTDLEEVDALISPIMDQADSFMREHFGDAEIPPTMRYIVIPQGFGAYALPGQAVFTDEDAFESPYNMRFLVHEFIHLGWNAKTEDRLVSRARFFDEGFTCYFQTRFLAELLGEDVYDSEIQRSKDILRSMYAEGYDQTVPLSRFGEYEYGGMSYYMGPLLFDELSKLVGVDVLDNATKAFLEKYRDTPVDFETMCSEYITLCDSPQLEDFFQDWVYSTDGIQRVLSED